MNFRILAKFLGALLLLESMAMIACGLFAWFDSASCADDPWPLFLSGLITSGVGGFLFLAGSIQSVKWARTTQYIKLVWTNLYGRFKIFNESCKWWDFVKSGELVEFVKSGELVEVIQSAKEDGFEEFEELVGGKTLKSEGIEEASDLVKFISSEKVPRREGVVVVGFGWLLCGIFGSFPYIFGDPSLPVADAFFESASGFTTTGSTVMVDIASWPRGILLWRSVTQWMGGMGILVLFVAILSYLGMGSKSLFRNESSFQTGEATSARIRDTAKTLWNVYVCITIVCIIGLKLMGLTLYNAVSHAFTVVSTGGFSPHNESIAYYSEWGNGWLIELWLSLFMVICSISFLFWVVLLSKRWKRLKDDEEGLFFIVLCFASTVVISFGVASSQGVEFWTALRQSWFTVTSIASTTGFGTVDYTQWPGFALVLLAGIMLLGGCSGSTAGGIKVSRLIVFFKTAHFEIIKAFRPNKVFRMHVNGNAIGVSDRAQTVVFVALYAFIVLIASFIVALIEAGHGIDMLTSFGAVVATLSNIGPGFGDVGPMDNFGHFYPVTKVFLGLLMILGRLELYAILVLFMPSIWRKY